MSRELLGSKVDRPRYLTVRWHPVWDVPYVPRKMPEADASAPPASTHPMAPPQQRGFAPPQGFDYPPPMNPMSMAPPHQFAPQHPGFGPPPPGMHMPPHGGGPNGLRPVRAFQNLIQADPFQAQGRSSPDRLTLSALPPWENRP